MHLETIVTCLDVAQSRPTALLDLIGVFRRTRLTPERFVVYLECLVQDIEATDGFVLQVRCRKAGQRSAWYDSGEELILAGSGPDVLQIPFVVDEVKPPKGRSLVTVLIDGRIAGEHVVDFGI